MKNRTKIELIVFVIVALVFLGSQFLGKGAGGETPEAQTTQAVQETTVDLNLLPSGESLAAGNTAESSKAAETKVQQGEKQTEKQTETAAEKETETAAQTAAQQGSADIPESGSAASSENISTIAEDGSYTDKDSVALYISVYGHLPDNYITKNKAKDAGWVSSKGNLPKVCPGMSIGGDRFGNYEGKLPEKKGRKYFECDINYNPKKGTRGAERIIYSNDGLVYYTKDHYNTFELLYGEP